MPSRRAAAATHVALLRGVNVGGKNRLAMTALAETFEEAGCEGVRTFIQSGNVLFRAPAAVAARLPSVVEARLAERYQVRTPVVLRTAAALRAALRGNPFLAAGAEEDALHVGFLADRPAGAAVAALDPQRSPGDAFAVRGREIYLRLGAGMAGTRLTTAWFDARLGTVSTFRNWRTARALVDLLAGPG